MRMNSCLVIFKRQKLKFFGLKVVKQLLNKNKKEIFVSRHGTMVLRWS